MPLGQKPKYGKNSIKVKMNLKLEISKYKTWCLKNGYSSKKDLSLLWYFNRSRRVKREGNIYYVKLNKKGRSYNLNNIKELFLKENGE